METKKSILVITILYLLGIIVISILYKINYKKLNNDYNKVLTELEYYHNIDTNAIHKIDSIEYNIRQKDSIIYNIKTEFINEIEIIKANNDVDAVAQFKELVESD